MKKKLLIWDFDGVIADTEKLWLKNRQYLLKKFYNIDLDWKTTELYMKGMSDVTKHQSLASHNIFTDETFWKKAIELDVETMKTQGFDLTENIEDIFKLNIKQCIATGGTKEKTKLKIDVVNISKYFPSHQVFTADMVEKGKPEPDLFLLAATYNNVLPDECVVIEDSIAGLTASIKANMTTIAFIDNNNQDKIETVKNMGVKYIYNNMIDIKELLIKLF